MVERLTVNLGVLRQTAPPRLAEAALLAALLAGLFWMPLVVLLLAIAMSVVIQGRHYKWLFLGSSCLLFLVLNLSKAVEGDLIYYLALQQYLTDRPIETLLSQDELKMVSNSYRTTELGFYGTLWLLTNVLGLDQLAIPLMAIMGVYVPTFLGLLLIGRAAGWNERLILAIATFTFFVALNFVQTTHLLRQYISSGILFLGFALYIVGHKRAALICALAACTVHNATFLLVSELLLLAGLLPYERRGEWGFGKLLRALVALMVIGASIIAVVIFNPDYLTAANGEISAWHYAVVGGFGALVYLYTRFVPVQQGFFYYSGLAFVATFLTSVGFFLLGLELLAFRYFVYLEWLYGLIVGAVLVSMQRGHRALRFIATSALSLAGAALFVLRVSRSPWEYGSGGTGLFLSDFFSVLGWF